MSCLPLGEALRLMSQAFPIRRALNVSRSILSCDLGHAGDVPTVGGTHPAHASRPPAPTPHMPPHSAPLAVSDKRTFYPLAA
jgi:hypothetical protein